MALNIQPGFNYVKRNADDFISWSTIASDLSKTISDVQTQRQEKRQEIEDDTNKLIRSMDEIQMGQNKTANQMYLDGVNQSSQATLAMNKLFKQGKISQAEYARFRQTMKDDWKQLKVAAKTYNTDYANALKDLEEDKLSALGELSFGNYAQMGDIQNKEIYVHPTDGRLYFASRNDKGELITDPASLMSINNMNNRATDLDRKYDLDTNVQNFVNNLGEQVNVEGGMIITDVSQRPEFKESVNNYAESIITNPRSALSILTDSSGLGYTVTTDKPKNDKEIQVKLDSNNRWQPVLSDTQLDDARSVIEDRINQSIDREEKESAIAVQKSKIYQDKIQFNIKTVIDEAKLKSNQLDILEKNRADTLDSVFDQIEDSIDPKDQITIFKNNVNAQTLGYEGRITVVDDEELDSFGDVLYNGEVVGNIGALDTPTSSEEIISNIKRVRGIDNLRGKEINTDYSIYNY
jgi:hypothetical protein